MATLMMLWTPWRVVAPVVHPTVVLDIKTVLVLLIITFIVARRK